MNLEHHRLALTLYRGQTPLSRLPLQPDWGPAEESVRLEHLRTTGSVRMPTEGAVNITPVWDQQCGEPFLEGFVGTLRAEGRTVSVAFTTAYFEASVRRAAAGLVKDGAIKAGEECAYRIAVDGAANRRARGTRGFTAESVHGQGAVVQPRSLAALSGTAGADDEEQALPLLLIPAEIVAEITQATREAHGLETGGVLVGTLHRDTARTDRLFGVVAAQLPATAAKRESTRLVFTPDVWFEAQQGIRLRNRDETMLGWWHSHPVCAWRKRCAGCPEAKRRACPLTQVGVLFSDEDCLLHRTVFQRAFQFAVVSTALETDIRISAFGWRAGQIVGRTLHILNGANADAPQGD